jgi:hypothetical protein
MQGSGQHFDAEVGLAFGPAAVLAHYRVRPSDTID